MHNTLMAAIGGAMLLGANAAAQAQDVSAAVASGPPRPLMVASRPEVARQTVTVGAFHIGDAANTAALGDNMRAVLIDALARDGRFAVAQANASFRIDGELTQHQTKPASDAKLQDASVEISLRVSDPAGRTLTTVSAHGSGSASADVAPFRDTAMGKASAEAFRQAVLKIAETTTRAQ